MGADVSQDGSAYALHNGVGPLSNASALHVAENPSEPQVRRLEGEAALSDDAPEREEADKHGRSGHQVL